jgi:hypothetical protein
MEKISFYAFSFNNPDRKRRLEEQFKKEQLCVNFIDPVLNNDPRLKDAPKEQLRNWAIMWSHLDMIKAFLNTDDAYGVFCEDDLILRKEFNKYVPELISSFKRRRLDILLLGYLTTQKPASLTLTDDFRSSDINLLYLEYDDNIWGAHMYLINRETAQRFLEIYTTEYANTTLLLSDVPAFSPDWTLTKIGRRALVYPMMGIEEGTVLTTDEAHVNFHRNCYNVHYDKNLFYN